MLKPKSWSATLKLPRSSFPARPVIADRPKYLKRCTDDLYAWQSQARAQKKSFVLRDGPPYANGDLHIGHALNKILKDITLRFQLSQGQRVTYVPGFDCHGLPIELKALRQELDGGKSLSNGDIDRNKSGNAVKIRGIARALASETVERQKNEFREWAIMGDWDRAWRTMDEGFVTAQLRVFKDLVRKKLIHQKHKPVYWSPSSSTALAEAELDYREDHVSRAAFVKFRLDNLPPAIQQKLQPGSDQVGVIVWTTTPWTLPSNKAIAVHSSLEYCLVNSARHGKLLVAETRLAEVEKALQEPLEVLLVMRGQELLGGTYRDQNFTHGDEDRRLLHADFVSSDSGSGLVHIAPGHGLEDHELCLRHGIADFAPVDDQGRFTAQASPTDPQLLLGKSVLTEGNQAVIDLLESKGDLLQQHDYKHKYPYDWRSKQPVILRATKQWFAHVGGIKAPALRSLDAVNFVPKNSRERLESFVRSRGEWCISRQRAWGVPIPALYKVSTGESLLTEESVTHIISVIQQRGINAWWTDDPLDPAWIPKSLQIPEDASIYRRGQDTMDVWFDSGTSWTQCLKMQSQGGEAKDHIADVCLEGTDQHRGWFQSSLLTHIAAVDTAPPQAPFKTLITHGFTLDADGRKMSKSIGNVISPKEIMHATLLPPIERKSKNTVTCNDPRVTYDALGPDALRLWAASCDFTRDVVVSQTVLKSINASLSKYRVTFKLLLGMLEDFCPQQNPSSVAKLDVVHQVAWLQLRNAKRLAHGYYSKYEYNHAIQEVNKYISNDLSAFYIESIKDATYTGTVESRKQAQFTLLHIYTDLQQMLAPVTPLLIEEAWEYTPSPIREWITPHFQRVWEEDNGPSFQGTTLASDLPGLMTLNGAVKRAQEAGRAEKKVTSSLQSFVMLQMDPLSGGRDREAERILQRYSEDFETLFVVSRVDVCIGELPAAVTGAEWSHSARCEISGSTVTAHVYTPGRVKCVRCWRYAAPLLSEPEKAVCARCEKVLVDLRQEMPELFERVKERGAAAAA